MAATSFIVAGPPAEAALITFVKGTVTAADSGAAVSGVNVRVFVDDGVRGRDPSPTVETTTDAAGAYSFHIRTGTYEIDFDPSAPYVSNSVEFTTPRNLRATVNDAVQLGATITGTVTDAVTHQPIPGVCVSAVQPPCTDAQGRYELDTVQPSSYFLVIVNGSGSVNPDYDAGSQHVATNPGQTTVVDFALTPTARVQLTVLDADGQPLQGAAVHRGTFGFSAAPFTDANGELLQPGLDPGPDGTVLLSFTPPASDTTDAGTTARIPVQRGQTTNYTVTMPRVAVVTVHVVHPDGSTHQGDCLSLVPGQPDQYESASGDCTDATDTITMRVSPETYDYDLFNISDARDEPQNNNGSFTAVSGPNDVTITIPRLVLGTMTGVVTDQSTGLPLVGATVSAEGLSTTTGTDGRYTLSQLGRNGTDDFVMAQPNDGVHAYVAKEATLVRGGTVTVNFALPLATG